MARSTEYAAAQQSDNTERLPSFDQLLASIATPPKTASPSPTPLSRLGTPVIPFATSRKTPTESPFTERDYLVRSPSSPPRSREELPERPSAVNTNRPRFRARAATVPSIFGRAAHVRPERFEHECTSMTPRQHPFEPARGHALGLAPAMTPSPHSHHEHHGDRVQEIKEGDGDMHLDDVVSPMILPERARPHFHGRHFSTSALPSLPHLHKMDYHDRINMPHHDHATVSPSRTPTSTTSTASFRSASYGGSHSPLSTCEPLTPRSIHMSFEERLESRREEWKGRAGRERSGTGSTDGGMRIPTLPRLR